MQICPSCNRPIFSTVQSTTVHNGVVKHASCGKKDRQANSRAHQERVAQSEEAERFFHPDADPLHELKTQIDELREGFAAHAEYHASVNALVRELDVMLNGSGAAQQASLCDIVCQIKRAGLKAATVPEGWKLVPVEATKEMMEAPNSMPPLRHVDLPLAKSGWSPNAICNRQRWQSMLAAAPQPPTDYTAIDSARDDEREAIALFLTATGRLGVAAELYAGMTRPIDKVQRDSATAVWKASKASHGSEHPGDMQLRGFKDDLQLQTAVKINTILLSAAEVQSGLTRVRWAERLIEQLPANHDGRNSWLLNYGTGEAAQELRRRRYGTSSESSKES